MVGIGRLARTGILIKGGQTLELLAGIQRMVFDKTGTLTTGSFTISQIDYLEGKPEGSAQPNSQTGTTFFPPDRKITREGDGGKDQWAGC